MSARNTGNPPRTEPRKRVYILKQTVVESYYVDPDEVCIEFGEHWANHGGSLEDFLIEMFQLHDGSQYGDRFFYNDADAKVGVELIERWDDE